MVVPLPPEVQVEVFLRENKRLIADKNELFQRALDAERERDEANKELLLLHAQYRQVSNLEALRVREIAALRAERDALRADLLALVPLACAMISIIDLGNVGSIEADPTQWEAARAILARVATEGAS